MSFHRFSSRISSGAFGILLALTSCGAALGANGDLIMTSWVLGNLREYGGICADSDGTFWAVSETWGKIVHLDATLAVELGRINNPHGTGTFPNYVQSRGIAFRPASPPARPVPTLLVLAKNGSDFQVREVDLLGTEVSAVFNINTSNLPSANLFGMAYDPNLNQIWLIDDNNDLVIRAKMDGIPFYTFSFPLDTPSETTLRGIGISFLQEGPSYIYITYGDIFTLAPTKIIELTTLGVPTGVEIPLGNVPPAVTGQPVKKIGALLTGTFGGRKEAIVLGEKGVIHVLDFTRPDPIPPTFFKATLTMDNLVNLTWINHGSGSGSKYMGAISILRDGMQIFWKPIGDIVEYLDESPPSEGLVSYSIKVSNGGPLSSPVQADVVIGKGGLLGWIPFPGIQPYDLAADPSSGDIYVTDSQGGRILRFNKDLVYQDDVPSPYPHPGGIAFRPINSLGTGPSLFVASSEEILALEIDLSGVHIDNPGQVSIDFGSIVNPKTGGLIFNPATGLYTCVEVSSRQLVTFDEYGNQMSVCKPPQVFTETLNEGIGFDAITGNFHATFDGGMVRELYTNCTPTNFNFDLSALGQLAPQANFVKGVEVSGNLLLIASGTANALFQTQIFPQGQTFIRGDLNRDGSPGLTDVVYIAQFLFRAGAVPFCLDAADTNDDGELDISDPVYLLYWLYVPASPPPPEPYPDPGHDPTYLDKLKC